ncbi:MAG: helix-turn-helix domain-containing protein, partial [Clostridiales bacterium]|nr:helix-turn-helix domain-containing protein [Clostridiales bacterium]
MKKQTMGMMIAEKRKEMGMTQLDLAGLMGVTDKAVSKWERDLSYPDVNALPKLAEVFGMSVDELMQIKTESVQQDTESPVRKIVSLALRGVC